MTTITQARQACADAVAAITPPAGLTLTARLRQTSDPRAGDVFTVVGPVQPADFRQCVAQIETVVVLGPDADRADTLADALTVPAIDAVTTSVPCFGVEAERVFWIIGEANAAPLYALSLTASLEVSQS